MLSFDQKELAFMASECASLLLCTKHVQRNCKHFFKDFKTKSGFCRLMWLKLPVQMLLIEIILGVKVTVNKARTERSCFGYFCRFATRAFTLRARCSGYHYCTTSFN